MLSNQYLGRGLVAIGWLLCACGKSSASDHDERARVEREMKEFIAGRLGEWREAAVQLQAALPAPSGRGWDLRRDAEAIAAAKAAWVRSRHAYELIEGAIAPTFPESDTATDARYDDFLGMLGPAGDANLFDAEGVVGMHALERVLWANSHPAEVVAFEQALPGYKRAELPATEAEARAFKDELAALLVSDIETLQAQFEPLILDTAFAFRGLVDLAVEQVEKVELAASGQEESRYAQLTMRDLRANREGCQRAYEIFRPWLLSRGGASEDASVKEAFARLEAAYAVVEGESIPSPPRRWSSLKPSEEQMQTPFGRLFSVVKREADEGVPGSLHSSLIAVAERLQLPKVVLR